MKIYKLGQDFLIEYKHAFYLLEKQNWDAFINDDNLYDKLNEIVTRQSAIDNGEELIKGNIDPPLQSQEIWASGVTYYSSKLGRQEESSDAGGGSFYARVYDADRPELFFKAPLSRTVGTGDVVHIRPDSTWDVPEPELTLVITSNKKIVGYTIGNDMSSRSIEGQNPLYLPQAKTYDGCAAVGPCILVRKDPLPLSTQIKMEIWRSGQVVFSDEISIEQIKRTFEELVEYLFKACSFPHGCLLMTGTGIVPTKDFTLQPKDEIRISIDEIGELVNTVRRGV